MSRSPANQRHVRSDFIYSLVGESLDLVIRIHDPFWWVGVAGEIHVHTFAFHPTKEPARSVLSYKSVFRRVSRIGHHGVERHERVAARFELRQYFIETVGRDVVYVTEQRLRNLAT